MNIRELVEQIDRLKKLKVVETMGADTLSDLEKDELRLEILGLELTEICVPIGYE